MASIPGLPANAPARDVVTCLENAGCVVVRDVTEGATRDALKRELALHLVTSDAGNRLNKAYEASGGNGSFYPGNTTRITALVAKSETFRSFVMHPLMLSACDAILKPNCANYQVHATAGLVVGPGARVQVLHREEDGFQFFKVPRPNMVLASIAGKRAAARAITRSSPPRCRPARCCSGWAARCMARARITPKKNGATASSFPTRSDGCAKRKISTSTRRRRSRARFQNRCGA
jgi:hypothetical protein